MVGYFNTSTSPSVRGLGKWLEKEGFRAIMTTARSPVETPSLSMRYRDKNGNTYDDVHDVIEYVHVRVYFTLESVSQGKVVCSRNKRWSKSTRKISRRSWREHTTDCCHWIRSPFRHAGISQAQ